MNANSRRTAGVAAAWLAILAAGCAGIDASKFKFGARSGDNVAGTSATDAATHDRSKKDAPSRMKEAATEFDQRRNDAQFLAAEASWRQGDAKHCRDSLEKILARDSAHRGAILLLADVHLEANRVLEAVEVLERGVTACPADAEIAYKLGVALEADGQRSESLHWLHQAVAKEPDNEKYQTALAQAKDDDSKATGSDSVAKSHPHAAANRSPAAAGSPPPQEPDTAAQLKAADSDNSAPAKANPADDSHPSAVTKARRASDRDKPDAAPLTRSDLEFQAALADWDAGRKQACEAKLLQLIVEDPKHVDAAILMAEVDLESGRQAEARGRVERLVIRHPFDPSVRRACGMTYEALGEKDLAAACFAKAESLEAEPPADMTTYREAAARNKARGAARHPAGESADLDLAVLETTTGAPAGRVNGASGERPADTGSQAPTDQAGRPNQTDRGSANGGEAEAAPSVLRFESDEPSASIRPGSKSTSRPAVARSKLAPAEWLQRGSAALAAGKIEAAREAFLEAIRTDPKNSQTGVQAAVAALKHEQPELALQLATKAIESLPRSAGLYRVQGTAAYKLGRFAEAEAALRQSLSLDNSQALSYFLLGSVQSRLGKNEAADGQFRQAAKLDRRYAVHR